MRSAYNIFFGASNTDPASIPLLDKQNDHEDDQELAIFPELEIKETIDAEDNQKELIINLQAEEVEVVIGFPGDSKQSTVDKDRNLIAEAWRNAYPDEAEKKEIAAVMPLPPRDNCAESCPAGLGYAMVGGTVSLGLTFFLTLRYEQILLESFGPEYASFFAYALPILTTVFGAGGGFSIWANIKELKNIPAAIINCSATMFSPQNTESEDQFDQNDIENNTRLVTASPP